MALDKYGGFSSLLVLFALIRLMESGSNQIHVIALACIKSHCSSEEMPNSYFILCLEKNRESDVKYSTRTHTNTHMFLNCISELVSWDYAPN